MSKAHVPPHAILKACDEYLNAHHARVEREREELIVAEMGKDRFFSAPWSREKAIKELKEEGRGLWWKLSWGGGFWASEVEALRQAALLAMMLGGTLSVDAEIADILNPYIVSDPL